MKLSIAIAGREATASAFVVWRGLEESIKKAAEFGYDGVELALKRPDEITRNDLGSLLKENKLAVSAVSSGQVFAARGLMFTEKDEEKRKELYTTFCGFIDLASDFGQKVNIGRVRGMMDYADTKGCMDRFLDMAHKVCDYAEDRGVTLILEPVNRYEINFINNTDECVELVKKVGRKNFTAMPDVFHMNIEDAHIGEALIRNRDYVDYIHFADSNRHAPGDGHMPFVEIMDALKSIGYTGWTTVECLPYPDPDTAARRAVKYLKETFPECYRK